MFYSNASSSKEDEEAKGCCQLICLQYLGYKDVTLSGFECFEDLTSEVDEEEEEELAKHCFSVGLEVGAESVVEG